MKRILHHLAALGLLVTATGCATAIPADADLARPFGLTHFGQAEFKDTNGDGLPDTRLPDSGPKGRIAKLDDITNEADNAPTESGVPLLAKVPALSRFFGDDGGDGDIRGRSENYFTDRVARQRAAAKVADPEQPTPNAIARKMIYSASYSVMVPVVGDAIQTLTTRVTALGGYLSQRNNATLTVRIPAAKFPSLIAEIPALGRVTSEAMNAHDVTNQHTDLTIRLENAEKSRQRLLALIDKATKMEDIIKIEEALRRITGEIERMKGQLKLMNDQVAFSTVAVSFQANAPQAKASKRRQQSRFPWINRIGIEQDLRRF